MRRIHPGRWVLNHALAQKNAGMDVEVVTQAHGASKDFVCEIEGIKVHFLRTYHPYRHLSLYALDSRRMAKYVLGLRPDIVHAHGTEAAYALAAVRTGCPFCVTAQGLFFQILPTLSPGLHLNERFLQLAEHKAWTRTHYAVAKSEYVRAALAEKYPHLDITSIPNTYQPELDTPLTPKTGHDLVFVGTVDERKGVHLIAEAMPKIVAAFPDVRLHVVGAKKLPPARIAELQNFQKTYSGKVLARLGGTLGERLVLEGKKKSTDLFSILDGCRILLAPSTEEMFGNQLIEGLMRGCHGIVTEYTALAENARRFGNATVVPQKDPEALADAVIAVLRKMDENGETEEIEGARRRIRAYMSPASVADSHKALYGRILSEWSVRGARLS